MSQYKISVIIPAYHFVNSLKNVLRGLEKQKEFIEEIIVVDSSTNEEISDLIIKNLLFPSLEIVYVKVDKAFPGEARNIGAKKAKGNWLAFLDSKTVPGRNWLEDSVKHIALNDLDVSFGVTRYEAQTNFQKLLQAATFGKIGHETTPGSIIKKELFFHSNTFIEGVRTADDLFWRQNIKFKKYKWQTPPSYSLTYSELPDKYLEILKRYFIYSWHTSRVNVQSNMKDLYLGIVLILSSLVVPRWNSLVGWEESVLYIPNVTKVYLLVVLFIFIVNLILRRIFPNESNENSFLWFSLKLIVFMALIGFSYKWNAVVAGWIEDSPLYFPHITKIYLSSVFLIAVLIRGVYMPLKRDVDLNFLLPTRWFLIGLIGVGLDLAKAPGYAFGAVISPFIKKSK